MRDTAILIEPTADTQRAFEDSPDSPETLPFSMTGDCIDQGPADEAPSTPDQHSHDRFSKSICPDPRLLKSRLMVIDDDQLQTRITMQYLHRLGYTACSFVNDSTQALHALRTEQPEALLLDLQMPTVSGIDILQVMRHDRELSRIPVIVLTGETDRDTRLQVLELGATDFLNKPIDRDELTARLRNALLTRRSQDQLREYAARLETTVEQLNGSRTELIQCLARAAEYRDNETGRHVIRVGYYARLLAERAGMDDVFVELIALAAQLHDIGKIGIPDSILLKPGKLTEEEYEIMQKHSGMGHRVLERTSSDETSVLRDHTSIGEQILGSANSPITRMASIIALTHHEKWDGSGYPLGLAGEDIPIEGRIVAIADVFDALSSRRPYKPAFPFERCCDILRDGRGAHFDPKLLDVFLDHRTEIVRIQLQYGDTE